MVAKQKVAILGAGPAGLAAASGLTSTKALRDLYEVTIYQVGWRAGGKCATGRSGPENRIKQNGTHYLFGCYDNTLAITKQAYAELDEKGIEGFAPFEASMVPRDLLALKHFFRGKWALWPLILPTNRAIPGEQTGFLRARDYVSMTLQGLLQMIFGLRVARWLRPVSPFDTDRPKILQSIYTILSPLYWLVTWIATLLCTALYKFTTGLLRLLGDPHYLSVAVVMSGIRRINHFIFGLPGKRFLTLFRLFVLIDFICSATIGLLRDKVPARGLSAIEKVEFRTWLKQHGADDRTLYAPFIATWYDAVAAYEDGEPGRPNMSAGVSIMAIGKALLTYKGHFAYQMRAEVGDTMIGPVYQSLKERGVNFRFFTRVWDVVAGADDTIEQIVIEQQVELKSGDPYSYDPFTRVKDMNVWPDQPLWDQLETPQPQEPVDMDSFYTTWRGERPAPLQRGKDFDIVICAMPVQSLPTYCAQLLARNPKWKTMTDCQQGVESQSIRLYFSSNLKQMGWKLSTPILSSYAMPFATWEDNGHLVEVETWPEDLEPKAIATLFGPLISPHVSPPYTDVNYPARQLAAVNNNTLTFLQKNIGPLWPKATTLVEPLAIDWAQLVDLGNGVGETRLEGQYLSANVGPLERYTQAQADTAKNRLPADGSGFDNLYLAGDWVENHFLIGSVEGAIMAGLQASRAICKMPQDIPGENTGL